MKKMIHVSLIKDGKISLKNEEVFLEEHNLKDYVLQTNFNDYKILSFSTIDIWEP